MPQLLACGEQTFRAENPAQVAGFISEWWPASNRNPGRLQIGISGRIKSEFARSFGAERERNLEPYGKSGVDDLKDFLDLLRVRAEQAGGYKKFWGRLAARIARACAFLKIERVALYTTRHIGIATAKSWMSPEQVAASAGQKTTRTATSHYARRRSGWGAKMGARAGLPRAEDVEKVIRSEKASRKENLAHQAQRQAYASPATERSAETPQDDIMETGETTLSRPRDPFAM